MVVTTPATSYINDPLTVTCLDQHGNTFTGYSGTVHFTSTDPGIVAPADSTLTNGTGSFFAAFKQAGIQTITVTDPTKIDGGELLKELLRRLFHREGVNK